MLSYKKKKFIMKRVKYTDNYHSKKSSTPSTRSAC